MSHEKIGLLIMAVSQDILRDDICYFFLKRTHLHLEQYIHPELGQPKCPTVKIHMPRCVQEERSEFELRTFSSIFQFVYSQNFNCKTFRSWWKKIVHHTLYMCFLITSVKERQLLVTTCLSYKLSFLLFHS